jgi:hypothetical protein
MNTLLILGAGASYGSDVANTPPLGSQLFDNLCTFNPDAWGSIPSEYSQNFHDDFEVALADLGNAHPHIIPPLQRAMAAYFFEFLPRRTSIYFNLENKIKLSQWDGAICTLNYERLLELSLASADIQPNVGSPTNAGTSIELCLPHGCCHLFCEGVHGTAHGVSFAGFGVTTNGPVTIISDPAQHRQRILNDAFPPVMSYFEPNKRTTAGASFITSQRTRWSELVDDANVIVAVGIRVRINDSHIWEPIQNCTADVYYCSGESAGAEFLEWSKNARPRSKNHMYSGYFSDEFENICEKLGL